MATADPQYAPPLYTGINFTPPEVIDGTGLTTTVPLLIKNGKSGSGVEVQVTSTISSGYSLLNSSGTTKGGMHLVATANDEITGSAAGDITITGDATKRLLIGALAGAAAGVTIDFATSRVGIGTTTPSIDLQVQKNANSGPGVFLSNNSAGVNANISLLLGNSNTYGATGASSYVQFTCLGTAFTAIGVFTAGSGTLNHAGNTGNLVLNGTTNGVILATGSTPTARLSLSNAGDLTVWDSGNVVVGSTTGTKFGTAVTQKLGFYNATPVVQQTRGATLTNSVTSGGTDDTIANYTDLTLYSNDAAAIRNNIYQLARILRQHDVALRALGLVS